MNADLLFSGNQYYNPRKAAKRRLRRGLPYWARLASISVIVLALVLSGCSKQMPCPKIEKQKGDNTFKPAAEGEGDESNNPTDNKANMTLGGGGIKRGKDGLVKKGKFKNLMSKNAKMRNYTKIKAPGGHDKVNREYTKIAAPGGADKVNRNYTEINNPGENKKAKPKYTKIQQPGGSDNVNRNYTKVQQPGGTDNTNRTTRNVNSPANKGKRKKYTDIDQPSKKKSNKGRRERNVEEPA